MTYLNYVWGILTKDQKKRSLILFFLILISTFLEVLGIGLIVRAYMRGKDHVEQQKI